MSDPMSMDGQFKPADGAVIQVEISVKAVRLGNSVRLDVKGVGERRPAGHVMEKAENWSVEALAGDRPLDRAVNGSVKVEREQVGTPALGLWDIHVSFSVAFTIPEDAEEIRVRVAAPDSASVYEEVLEIGPASKSKGKGKGKKDKKKDKKRGK